MTDPSDELPPDWRRFEVEQSGASSGRCDCCGTTTRRVWGLIRRDGTPVASYFVGWAEGKPDHGASFDLILGKWGKSATKRDRFVVAFDFRIFESSPRFMVVDGQVRLPSYGTLSDTALTRTDVIGTPLASQAFALVDAIYMGDSRLEELREWSA